MKLTIWREGDHAFFDWTGTDPQALGPINFYLSEGMFKMFIGIYLIMVNDPQILFNDGFYPLLHVVMPEGSLLRPRFPAALGCRTHALARLFDVLGGALVQERPGAEHGRRLRHEPVHALLGLGREGRLLLLDGDPLRRDPRPADRRRHGRPLVVAAFENIPTEYLEAYYPMRIDGYTTVTDSGGAGFHRGGNGVEKRYVYLEPGEVSIHDDRWLTRPWGVLGGWPGARSAKLLKRADGTEQVLPSKCDHVEVEPGDMLVYRTAGGGGWKDRLDRPVEAVARDVSFGLVSRELAKEGYGVVLRRRRPVDAARDEPSATGSARSAATRPRSTSGRRSRSWSDAARRETGLDAARAGRAAALVAAPARRQKRSPKRREGQSCQSRGVKSPRGFGERAGFGQQPALVVIDIDPRLHPRHPASPLATWTRRCGDRAAAGGFRAAGLPVVSPRRSSTTTASRRRGVRREVPALLALEAGLPRGRDRPAHRAGARTSRC